MTLTPRVFSGIFFSQPSPGSPVISVISPQQLPVLQLTDFNKQASNRRGVVHTNLSFPFIRLMPVLKGGIISKSIGTSTPAQGWHPASQQYPLWAGQGAGAGLLGGSSKGCRVLWVPWCSAVARTSIRLG